MGGPLGRFCAGAYAGPGARERRPRRGQGFAVRAPMLDHRRRARICEQTGRQRVCGDERLLRRAMKGKAIVETIEPNGDVVTLDIEAAPHKVKLHPQVEIDLWTFNKQVPGPAIRMQLGQTLRVKFKNSLPQPTTIHWHGVRVPNAMDGVPGVNQDPIAPGETASITVKFNSKNKKGSVARK